MGTTEVVTIVSAVGSTSVVTSVITWLLTRKRANAESEAKVELTEAQADEIRQGIYDKLVVRLEGEIARLQDRVEDLETRLSTFDLALREKSAELVATQIERDRLRLQLEVAHAEIAAKDREIMDLRAAIAAFTGVHKEA